MSPSVAQGRLLVKAANIGRRALTIEKIYVQGFQNELEELRKAPVAEVGRVERIGFVARFTTFTRPSRFPVQLGENEPITVEMIIVRVDDLSRNRFCLEQLATTKRDPQTKEAGATRTRCGARAGTQF